MTVTRLGQAVPLMNAGLGYTSQVPPGGGSGQIPTSDGSNGVYWGENIARISANGSNALLGPFASFVSGSGITLSVSSNAMTITGSGTGGSTSLPWYDMKTDGGLVGNGVADDTAAFQAAITAGTSSGTVSRTFYFPPGTYLIGGALQDTGAFNGQILLPNVSTSAAQITIKFVGAARPPFAVGGPIPAPGGYSIIKSTLTGASGTAACISGGNQVFTSKNNIQVVVENLLCTAPDNPTFTFWNLSACQGGAIQDLMITMTSWSSATLPTHSNAYGIKLPQRGQSNYTYVDGLCVYVFYTGVQIGELTIAKGLIFGADVRAVELTSAPHPSLIVNMHQTGCGTGIKVTAGSFPVSCDVLVYNAEHMGSSSGGLTVTTYDLDDSSDALNGHIRWLCADNSGPVDHVFNVNGGTNSSNAEMGPLTGGTPASSVTDETTWGITPAVGTDTEYARQDHTHGTPDEPTGGGEILITDTPAGSPLIFADLLQNEAGTDLLYSG